KTALLGARDAADIGVPSVPLGVLHGQAAGVLLARLGAQVRLSAKVAAIEVLPGGPGPRFRVRLAGRRGGDGPPPDGAAQDGGGEVIEADGVVLAGPPAIAGSPAPTGTVSMGTVSVGTVGTGTVGTGTVGEPAAAGNGHGLLGQPGPEQWQELATSPIVNVHVIYDRRVTRLPFAAAVDSPVQWVFDRTGPSGLREGQYLAISLSAADAYADVPAARLRERFLPALAELFPAAAQARVLDCFVTRERRATMHQVPGVGRLRPGAATAVPGLVLAGARADTRGPGTMGGAGRGGLNGTAELRRRRRSPRALRWPDGRPAAAGSPAVGSGTGAPA